MMCVPVNAVFLFAFPMLHTYTGALAQVEGGPEAPHRAAQHPHGGVVLQADQHEEAGGPAGLGREPGGAQRGRYSYSSTFLRLTSRICSFTHNAQG